MARTHPRATPDQEYTLEVERKTCACCGRPTKVDYENDRTVVTLKGIVRLVMKIRRCHNLKCAFFLRPMRPESELGMALPAAEIGLDVIAFVGALRYQEHKSIPEIHAALKARAVEISQRSVTNQLYRYEELLALRLTDGNRVRAKLRKQGRVVLALDGLQPDVGHEVLWILRDALSGVVLLAKTLLGSGEGEIGPLLEEARAGLGDKIPIVGVVSDGQRSIRKAVAHVLPGVPHQLCQFHFLREAGRPVYEADRHAKVALKAGVRGVRAIERELEADPSSEADAVRDYCVAVRSALTDDGRPPLTASGLKLHDRLQAIADSTGRVLRDKPDADRQAPRKGAKKGAP